MIQGCGCCPRGGVRSQSLATCSAGLRTAQASPRPTTAAACSPRKRKPCRVLSLECGDNVERETSLLHRIIPPLLGWGQPCVSASLSGIYEQLHLFSISSRASATSAVLVQLQHLRANAPRRRNSLPHIDRGFTMTAQRASWFVCAGPFSRLCTNTSPVRRVGCFYCSPPPACRPATPIREQLEFQRSLCKPRYCACTVACSK